MANLEAKYIQSKKDSAPIALILHPHPEYGGTMNNRVTLQRLSYLFTK